MHDPIRDKGETVKPRGVTASPSLLILMRRYTLNKKFEPVQVADDDYSSFDNRWQIQHKKGEVRVSTVFLGLDHNWMGGGPPILFETMIFEGEHDQYQTRCATYEEALQMHRNALELVGIKAKVMDERRLDLADLKTFETQKRKIKL